MEEAPSRRMAFTLWLCSFVAVVALPTLRVRAQENATQSPPAQKSSKKKSVLFQVPEGYYANMSLATKKVGVIMLVPNRGAGMFIVYPGDGQSAAELVDEIKRTVAGMFLE